ADRRAVLSDIAAVRRGLLAARLSTERWIDGDIEGRHVRELWGELVWDKLAELPQGLWCVAMAPYLYQPTTDEGHPWARIGEDRMWAEGAYGQLFDQPMRRAERGVLVEAARQTWSWRDAQAGLLGIGEQRVHLDRQEVVVEPRGDFARVTIHDVYRDKTSVREEISLHFSLPQTAVVTGLWLGPGDDRSEAFAAVVAPRGAAQEVYNAEVRRRVDPALLEAVGPQQYRLRAFPVEPRQGAADVWHLGEPGPPLHLWLEVIVPRQGDGAAAHWPLPVASEVRNLFWDASTDRDEDVDAWLPGRIPAKDAPRRGGSAVVGGLR
ncbi:MAG TPA: TIGR02921 family PEP-CTERM protein, partial [Deltaproteobacteria bacterium]|nr:TIGR02921 family PEP-CTERM protein [Deltaproteobacteria bacterium]